MFRPSKCDLREETGFWETDNISLASQSVTMRAHDRCAIRVIIVPSLHGLPIAIACADDSTYTIEPNRLVVLDAGGCRCDSNGVNRVGSFLCLNLALAEPHSGGFAWTRPCLARARSTGTAAVRGDNGLARLLGRDRAV